MRNTFFTVSLLALLSSTFAFAQQASLLSQPLDAVVPGESSIDLLHIDHFLDGLYQNGEHPVPLNEKLPYCRLQVSQYGGAFIQGPFRIDEIESSLWGNETNSFSYRTAIDFSTFDASSSSGLRGEIVCHKPFKNQYDPITVGEMEAAFGPVLAFASIKLTGINVTDARDIFSSFYAVTPADILGVKTTDASGNNTLSKLVLSFPKSLPLTRQEDDTHSKEYPLLYTAHLEDGKVVDLPSFKRPHATVYVYTSKEQTSLSASELSSPQNASSSTHARLIEFINNGVPHGLHEDSSTLNLEYAKQGDRIISLVLYSGETTSPINVGNLTTILGAAPVRHFISIP